MLKRKLLKNILVLALFSAAVVTACGKKAETGSSSIAKEQENASSSSGVSVEIPPMSSNGVIYGVIISASEKSMTLQSDMGTTVKFAIDKDIDIAGVKEGIATGTAVRVEYEEKSKKKAAKNMKIKKVLDSEKLPKLDKAALEIAGAIILAVENKDKIALAGLCEYPLVFDTGEETKIGSAKDFTSIKSEQLFTKRLVSSVSKTNLFVTNAYEDGFLLGLSKPNIVVSSTKNGYLITGFHYK